MEIDLEKREVEPEEEEHETTSDKGECNPEDVNWVKAKIEKGDHEIVEQAIELGLVNLECTQEKKEELEEEKPEMK